MTLNVLPETRCLLKRIQLSSAQHRQATQRHTNILHPLLRCSVSCPLIPLHSHFITCSYQYLMVLWPLLVQSDPLALVAIMYFKGLVSLLAINTLIKLYLCGKSERLMEMLSISIALMVTISPNLRHSYQNFSLWSTVQKATIHQVTTMLETSKLFYIHVITTW